MAGAVGAGEIEGLSDLIHTFRELEPALAREWRAELREIGRPVQERAQQLAGVEIHNILSPTAVVDWWQMRIGVDGRDGVVYVAPQQRGLRVGERKRPNLAGLLESKAMQPAVDETRAEIFARAEAMVNRLIEQYG